MDKVNKIIDLGKISLIEVVELMEEKGNYFVSGQGNGKVKIEIEDD